MIIMTYYLPYIGGDMKTETMLPAEGAGENSFEGERH